MDLLNPSKGKLLIAKPSILNDCSFNRSIILLTEHSNESTVGFILNKPLNYTLKDLVPEINCDFRIYKGGPVEEDNLYFIHKAPELIPKSIKVGDGIYWGGDFNSLTNLLNNQKIPENTIRFFLGYVGWKSGQLEDEIKTESWFCTKNNYQNIFNLENQSSWKNHLLKIGGKYKLWANAPIDPRLN